MMNMDKVKDWCLAHLEDEGNRYGIIATTQDECIRLADMLQPFVPEATSFWKLIRDQNKCTIFPTNHKFGCINFRYDSDLKSECITFSDFIRETSEEPVSLFDYITE
jgi:hypothetical protein